MKLAILLLICVSRAPAITISANLGTVDTAAVLGNTSVTNSSNHAPVNTTVVLVKQKFLFEVLYRVTAPLMFEELIEYGQNLILNKSYYRHYDSSMDKFYATFQAGELLPKGEYFGVLVKTHYEQALGLFNFFQYSRSFEIFRQNVCWARMNVNEGMFVFALTMAVIHCADSKDVALPAIYEIFPENFFNSKFIYAAAKFDSSTFNNSSKNETDKNGKFNGKDFKTWQWWKLMGLSEDWFVEEQGWPLRETLYQYYNDEEWISIMKDVQMFWRPVDYTRDIQYLNEYTKLSYFTEDVGWNSYWYNLNMYYAFTITGEVLWFNRDRSIQYWFFNVWQILCRRYIEGLSQGLGEVPEFAWYNKFKYRYDPQLISYNGIGYSSRKNYFDYETHGNFDLLNHLSGALKRIYDIIDSGYYTTYDGVKIDLRKPESIEYIGNYMLGTNDTYDKYFFNYWYLFSNMYLANDDYRDFIVTPSVFLNFETMMRDPMSYILHNGINAVFSYFMQQFEPYTTEELSFPGVKFENVEVSGLFTYHDLVDFDVTNLLNEKMVFVDGQFVWDKALFARQARLNHKPFYFNFTIESDKPQKVVIRTFYGPKFDEFGRALSIVENRGSFFELDKFVYGLTAGENVFNRSSEDFYYTLKDRTLYTERYHYVMAGFNGQYDYPLGVSKPTCGFPDRLILPKGRAEGFPVQFFFFIAPYNSTYQEQKKSVNSFPCGIGSADVDNKPFGFPIERPIDEFQFFVPNSLLKDAKIYHIDTFEKYFQEYTNYGNFDYTFFNDYYTKYFQ